MLVVCPSSSFTAPPLGPDDADDGFDTGGDDDDDDEPWRRGYVTPRGSPQLEAGPSRKSQRTGEEPALPLPPPPPPPIQSAAEPPPPHVHVTSRTASRFTFAPDPTAESPANASCGWRELHEWLNDEGRRVEEGWVENHYRWIVWKLACQQRRGAAAPRFSAETVLRQLRDRYEAERVDKSRGRSALKTVLERWPPEMDHKSHMVLCIAAVDPDHNYALELTDGWYSAWAGCDAPLRRQIERGRLRVGQKLRLCFAEWNGEPDSDTPLWSADPATPRMKLRANSTRRAAPDAQLGMQRARLFRVDIGSLQPDGGCAPLLQVRVLRVYGPLYLQKSDDADDRGTWFTRRGFDAAQAKREQRHIERMERRAYDGGGNGDGSGGGNEDDDQAGSPQLRTRCKWVLEVADLPHDVRSRRDAHGVDEPDEPRATVALWGDDPGTLVEMGLREGSCCELHCALLEERQGHDRTHSSSGGRAVALKVKAARNILPFQSAAAKAAGKGRNHVCELPGHLQRAYMPLGGLASLQGQQHGSKLTGGLLPGPQFDTVGILVCAGEVSAARWEGRQQQQLWLADDSNSLLCVIWTFGAAELALTSKVSIFEPLSVRNARYVTRSRFQPMPGAEHLAPDGAIDCHMCEAEVLSASYPAELCTGNLDGATHLKEHVARLREAKAGLGLHLAQLAHIAADIIRGYMKPVTANVPASPLPQHLPIAPPPQPLQPRQIYQNTQTVWPPPYQTKPPNQQPLPPQPYPPHQQQPCQPQSSHLLPQMQPHQHQPQPQLMAAPQHHPLPQRQQLEIQRQEGADSVLQGIVLKFISSQSDGASVQDAVKHCLGLGAASDALVVQRVVDQLAADVQIYCDDKNRMRPL